MRFVQGRWRVRLRSILASTALGVLPACGPDESLEPAVHGDVCGELGPVRILELDGDRTPFSVAEFANVEDRRVLRASYPEETQDGDLPAVGRNELWSVGQCGESPLRLGDDAPFGGIEAWPDVLLTCRPSTGEIRTLDPWGERAPNVVFDLPDCSALRTHWGLIVVEPIDDDTGVLVLWSHPEDPWTETATSTVLLDSIRIRATPSHSSTELHEVLAVSDDDVFAITPDDDLVHLSLIDGSAVTEASNVREFEVSPDRRWIIWQDTEITDDDPEWPSGPVYLRDRMSATTLRLDDAALAGTLPSSFSFIDRNLVRLRLGYLYEEPERAYLLPSLQSFEFPLDREPLRAIGDRFLVEDFFGQSSLEWFDPVTGATEVFFESGGMMMFKGDGFEILEGARCCIEQDLSQRQSKLWYVPITGDRQLLAHRATMQYASLSDRRLITTLDVDDDRIGDLIAVDPDSLEERLVDERVIWSGVGIADDDTMLYAVDDDERTGVWLARLTPLE